MSATGAGGRGPKDSPNAESAPIAEVSPVSDDRLYVRIHGYSAAQGTISRERWESMDRDERRDWAMSVLENSGEMTDVTTAMAEDDGEFHSEEEW